MTMGVDGARIREFAGGVNQRGLRNYNERLLLTTLQRFGPTAGSDLARQTGLSPQTVSIILRKLENDKMIMRGDPVKGRVGKPSVPMQLCPDGAFALGLKIGRQSAELLLLDFTGAVRARAALKYRVPEPKKIFDYLAMAIPEVLSTLDDGLLTRVCGIGVATPFEIWKWSDTTVTHSARYRSWKDVDFAASVASVTDYPVYMVNDATAACRAEHLYGRGKEFNDYAYFFVGAFIGGGVVLNDNVFEGKQGNAGALGSLRTTGPQGEARQLIDVASLHLLEARLTEAGLDAAMLKSSPDDWHALARYVDPWIGQTAQELAKAALSVCSVIDFEAILIDGAFPAHVREDLVERTCRYAVTQDARGLIAPQIAAGSIGGNARAIGAASGPIFAQFFLDSQAGLAGRS